eukprot:TRINITY_DN6544_c0_g1_i1.p1 TRINITY_DN6544_c0_g1~~TRINITY_DN6544_c0_g1_i1.p1  ORF type:complete len:930 (+),score=218.40 TRINITY_DN6544_c0_g1_i1:52-2841(+)
MTKAMPIHSCGSTFVLFTLSLFLSGEALVDSDFLSGGQGAMSADEARLNEKPTNLRVIAGESSKHAGVEVRVLQQHNRAPVEIPPEGMKLSQEQALLLKYNFVTVEYWVDKEVENQFGGIGSILLRLPVRYKDNGYRFFTGHNDAVVSCHAVLKTKLKTLPSNNTEEGINLAGDDSDIASCVVSNDMRNDAQRPSRSAVAVALKAQQMMSKVREGKKWRFITFLIKNAPATPPGRGPNAEEGASSNKANSFQVELHSTGPGEPQVLAKMSFEALPIIPIWQCAYTDFVLSTVCDAQCGGGFRWRKRRRLHAPPKDLPLTLQVHCDQDTMIKEPCNMQPCDVNCELGEWTAWPKGSCSKDCDGGFVTERKEIIVGPHGKGDRCPSWDEVGVRVRADKAPCNEGVACKAKCIESSLAPEYLSRAITEKKAKPAVVEVSAKSPAPATSEKVTPAVAENANNANNANVDNSAGRAKSATSAEAEPQDELKPAGSPTGSPEPQDELKAAGSPAGSPEPQDELKAAGSPAGSPEPQDELQSAGLPAGSPAASPAAAAPSEAESPAASPEASPAAPAPGDADDNQAAQSDSNADDAPVSSLLALGSVDSSLSSRSSNSLREAPGVVKSPCSKPCGGGKRKLVLPSKSKDVRAESCEVVFEEPCNTFMCKPLMFAPANAWQYPVADKWFLLEITFVIEELAQSLALSAPPHFEFATTGETKPGAEDACLIVEHSLNNLLSCHIYPGEAQKLIINFSHPLEPQNPGNPKRDYYTIKTWVKHPAECSEAAGNGACRAESGQRDWVLTVLDDEPDHLWEHVTASYDYYVDEASASAAIAMREQEDMSCTDPNTKKLVDCNLLERASPKEAPKEADKAAGPDGEAPTADSQNKESSLLEAGKASVESLSGSKLHRLNSERAKQRHRLSLDAAAGAEARGRM